MFTILLAVMFASLTLAQNDDLLFVQTQQGPVLGTHVFPGVRQFLGIPYAVANRWEAPQGPPPRTATFTTANFSDSCVQDLNSAALKFLSLSGLANQRVRESENCLSVNIWTPSAGRKQNTAVMLWIYGGGFQFGTSNTVFYNGQYLVRDNDDILLVTMNYRTNIFGSPNAPQLSGTTQSQNFGLLDVDMAIQWVHANIAAFGGNPERITLFGQSAGSAIIDLYTYTHPNDTIVKGVIQQSGSAAGQPFLASSSSLNSTAWNTIGEVLGCGNDTTPEQLKCMKAMPFRKLEDAVINTNITFGVMIDDITIPSDINTRSAAGKFLKVPLLIGNTAQEGDIFVVAAEQLDLGFEIPLITQVVSDGLTEWLEFACPASTTANDRVKAGVPTWRYQYQAIFPDISSLPDLRAFHASEIPIIFGTYNSSVFGPPNNIEIALSRYVQGAWVAFARDPQKGLSDYGWPQYNPTTLSVAQLGNTFNQTGVIFGQGLLLDLGCNVLAAVIAAVDIVMAIFGSIM